MQRSGSKPIPEFVIGLVVIVAFSALVSATSLLVALWARSGLQTDYIEWLFAFSFSIILVAAPLWIVDSNNKFSVQNFAFRNLVLSVSIVVGLSVIALLPMNEWIGRFLVSTLLVASLGKLFYASYLSIFRRQLGLMGITLIGVLLGVILVWGTYRVQVASDGFVDIRNAFRNTFGILRPSPMFITFLLLVLSYFGLSNVRNISESKQTKLDFLFGGALAFMAAFLIACALIFTQQGYIQYDSIYSPELNAVGLRHLDTSFHQAIINGIQLVGYPSTGQDGYVFTYYHFVSHAVIAGITNLAKIAPENTLHIFRTAIIPGWFVLVAALSVYSVIGRHYSNIKPAPKWFLITLAALISIFLNLPQYGLVSTPSSIASILILSGVPVLFGEILGPRTETKYGNYLILFLVGVLIAFAKVSAGYIFLAFSGWVLLMRHGFSLKVIGFGLASVIVLLLNLKLFSTYYPASPTDPTIEISSLGPIETRFPLVLLLCLLLPFTKFTKFLPINRILWGWVGLAILPIVFLNISTSDQAYFFLAAFQLSWVSLLIFLYLIVEGYCSKKEISPEGSFGSPLAEQNSRFRSIFLPLIVSGLLFISPSFENAADPIGAMQKTASFVVLQTSKRVQLAKLPAPSWPGNDQTKTRIKRTEKAAKLVKSNFSKKGQLMPAGMSSALSEHPFSSLFSTLRSEREKLVEKHGSPLDVGVFLGSDLAPWRTSLNVSMPDAHIAMKIFGLLGMPLIDGIDPENKKAANGFRYGWYVYGENSYRIDGAEVSNAQLCVLASKLGLDAVLRIASLNPINLVPLVCE